jgi:hypothetical protein
MIEETYESDEVTCPYCGLKQSESYELDEDSQQEILCDCGKKYWGERVTITNYKGMPDCELNNQKHKLEEVKGHPTIMKCKICNKYKCIVEDEEKNGN